MTGVLSAIFYFFAVYICFLFSRSYVVGNIETGKRTSNLSFPLILFFSALFTLFNAFCTSNESEWRGDRLQYFRDFNGRHIDSNLSVIIDLIKSHSGSFEFLLYSTTFLCCLLIFISYKYSKHSTPFSLLVFLCTDTILYSYTRLKQAYAIAIAVLLFSLLLNKESKITLTIIEICLLIILCGFHVSGFIMVPLFILIKYYKGKKHNIYIILIAIMIFFISFQPVLRFIANHTESLIPELSSKINEYFSEEQYNVGDGSLFYFLKGIPYYFFFILGLSCRKKLVSKIDNYDIYLVIVLCCSLSFILSLWSYWLKRTSVYFCFTSIEFGILIIRNLENEKMKRFLYTGTFMFFVILLSRYFYQSFSNYGCLI